MRLLGRNAKDGNEWEAEVAHLDWGGLDLMFMHAWAVSDLRRYLTTLPGIGYKAATCVVGYSFGRDVCPVDTHTYRVAVRLGLVPPETPELGRPAHVAVELSLPQGERLGFHINAVAHGRARCYVEDPNCVDIRRDVVAGGLHQRIALRPSAGV